MIHSDQPPSFKASARLAPGPGFSEVHIVAVGARLRYDPSAAKITWLRLSLKLAINLPWNGGHLLIRLFSAFANQDTAIARCALRLADHAR